MGRKPKLGASDASLQRLQRMQLGPRPPTANLDARLAEAANNMARESVIREATQGLPGMQPPVEEVDVQALQREYTLLSKTLLEEKRELAKADFWYFITEVLFLEVWQKHYAEGLQGMMARELQQLAPGESIWFFIFRSGRKSYIADMCHNWWLIVRDPNIRILLVGAREETVKPFARLMLQPFIPGAPGFEEFQRVFPEYVFGDARGQHLRQSFQFTHPLRTKTLADPTFRATYLGVAGAGWRCDLLKYDDCIERKKVSTPEQSAKSLRDMLDLLPLLDMTGDYRMTVGMGTPWVYHDPYARIMGIEQPGATQEEQEAADAFVSRSKTKIIIRHALEHPTTRCDDCPPRVVAMYPHGKFSIDEGIPPDYPVHTREMILGELDKYAQDAERGESLFYHQYGVIYRSPKDQKFKPEWVITAPFPYFRVFKKRVLALDAADKDFQKENTGDWMVALFGEFDDFGRLLLVHGLRSRAWTRAQFQDAILSWCLGSGWWPNIAAKEKFAESGGSFLTSLGAKFWEHQKPVHLVPVMRPQFGGQLGTMKKNDYIVGNLQAPMERAEVVFGSAFPPAIRERCGHELLNLGQLKNDDVADTLALFMDPKVKLQAVTAMVGGGEQWVPPDLASYGGPPAAAAEAAADPMGYALRILNDRGTFQGLDVQVVDRGQGPDKPPPGGFQIIVS